MNAKEKSILTNEIARKLRVVVEEYGEKVLEGVSIISVYPELGGVVCGFEHYYCPTIASVALITRADPEARNNRTYKAAQLFEDT